MFGSNVRAWCSIAPHDDVPAIALTPSSYQTLREPMCRIASANASNASRLAHTPTWRRRRGSRRGSGRADGGEKVDDGIDSSGVGGEVVTGDGDGARAVD